MAILLVLLAGPAIYLTSLDRPGFVEAARHRNPHTPLEFRLPSPPLRLLAQPEIGALIPHPEHTRLTAHFEDGGAPLVFKGRDWL